MNFKVVLKRGVNGWITVTVPSLPGCISHGESEAEAIKNIKEAIALHVESLAEGGIPILQRQKERMVTVKVWQSCQ